MKNIILISLFILTACDTQTPEPQVVEDFKSHTEQVNNLIVNGNRCLYEASTVCDVPFQALFSTDVYLNKHIKVRGVFVIKKLHYRPDRKASYHAFLFQSPEQYRLCDPNSSIELIFNDPDSIYDRYKSLSGSYIYVQGDLLPRIQSPWRRLDVTRGISMKNLLIDSKLLAPRDTSECMEQFSPLPPL
jgi:hypothetical protein